MSGRDRQLPLGDRDEEPDPAPAPDETFSQRLERMARAQHPKLMAAADALAPTRWRPRGDGDARIDAILRGEDPDAPGVDG